MRRTTMKKALVTGVGRYLPEQRKITTEEMEEMAGYDKIRCALRIMQKC